MYGARQLTASAQPVEIYDRPRDSRYWALLGIVPWALLLILAACCLCSSKKPDSDHRVDEIVVAKTPPAWTFIDRDAVPN